MAYGSSQARAYYGAGDYQSAAALRGYVPGTYYAAGGFGSFLKKTVGKAAKFVATNKLAGAALSAIPGMAPTLAAAKMFAGGGASLGDALVPGYSSVMKGGLLGTKLKAAITTTKAPAGARTSLPALSMGGLAENPRRRKRRAPARRRTSRRKPRSRSRKRRSYPRGDWGDVGGRDKRGHYLNDRGGHANFKRKRRRRGGRGGRVSFTTKDGRRVSFNARGDAQ